MLWATKEKEIIKTRQTAATTGPRHSLSTESYLLVFAGGVLGVWGFCLFVCFLGETVIACE